MKQKAIFPKVANDMLWVQLTWTFGFLGIMLAINIYKIISAIIQGGMADPYYEVVFIAANIYMLVIGIISINFLPYFVENGITRKDYFKGTLIAAAGLSIVIPVIAFLVSAVENLIVTNATEMKYNPSDINMVVLETDGSIIDDAVQSIILTPFVDPGSNWILAIIVFSLNIFTYYILGWLISAAFYRFGTIAGLGFILLALFMLMLEDSLLRISLDLPVLERFTVLDFLPSGLAVLGILLIVIVTVWLIRLLTKRVSIKM